MRIAGILLAAGIGQRFGGDKLLATLQAGPEAGVPIAVAAARRLRAAVPDSVAVVREGHTMLQLALAAEGLRVVECATAADGMGASLACGVQATVGADGWVVALADMPWISVATIAAVRSGLLARASIVAPQFRGRRGHPVGFAAQHGEALAQLDGDAGARALLQREHARIVLVDVDDAGILRDVDVPADLSAQQ